MHSDFVVYTSNISENLIPGGSSGSSPVWSEAMLTSLLGYLYFVASQFIILSVFVVNFVFLLFLIGYEKLSHSCCCWRATTITGWLKCFGIKSYKFTSLMILVAWLWTLISLMPYNHLPATKIYIEILNCVSKAASETSVITHLFSLEYK